MTSSIDLELNFRFEYSAAFAPTSGNKGVDYSTLMMINIEERAEPRTFVVSIFFFAVDMLSLSAALEQFDSHGLRAQNDKLIDIPDMVTVLTSLYEVITSDNPTPMSVPLCIDLAINWLLNVYDRCVQSAIIVSQLTGAVQIFHVRSDR